MWIFEKLGGTNPQSFLTFSRIPHPLNPILQISYALFTISFRSFCQHWEIADSIEGKVSRRWEVHIGLFAAFSGGRAWPDERERRVFL